MAISIVAGTAVGSSSSNVVTKPTGTASGDLILMLINSSGASTLPTQPTGFTSLDSQSDSGNGCFTRVAYKIAGSSEPASWTFTPGSGSTFDVWCCITLRGMDGTTPIDAHDSLNTAAATFSLASLTASLAGDALVILINDTSDFDVSSWPSGVTEYAAASNATTNGVITGTKLSLASGATGSLSITLTSASTSTQAFGILVKAPGGTTVNGSATATAEAGVGGGIATGAGAGGGIAGWAGVFTGLSASAALPSGFSSTAGILGGLSGQGKVVASSASLNSATVIGTAGALEGVAGQGLVSASSVALNSATVTGSAGTGGGIHAGSSLQSGLLAGLSAVGQAISGLAALGANFLGGVGTLPSPTGTVGSGSGPVNGSATIFAAAAVLFGLAGNAAVNPRSSAAGSSTVVGSAATGGGIAAQGLVSASSVGSTPATATGSGAVGTGQSGSASVHVTSAATPSVTLTGSGNLGGFMAGMASILASAQAIIHPPFAWAFSSITQLLKMAFGSKQAVTFVYGTTQALIFSFAARSVMATPNTTITVTMTATDMNGQPVPNLATCAVTVTFPDLSTQAFSLVSGVTNLGSGKYSITYVTKGVGECLEDWSGVDAAGNKAEFHNVTPVSF